MAGTSIKSRLVQAHPRWRGAHPRRIICRRLTGGSSPLARGTLPLGGESRRRRRLIPAGAGHMPGSTSSIVPLPAHPRWRGAHGGSVSLLTRKSGSSPLARGTWGRAVPHKANLTAHPRWRGAHRSVSVATDPETGSSPLARGTSGPSISGAGIEGLIPAGAGHIH